MIKFFINNLIQPVQILITYAKRQQLNRQLMGHCLKLKKRNGTHMALDIVQTNQ